MAIQGYLGTITGTDGASVAMTNEAMSDTSTARITYRINNLTKGWWDNNKAYVVEVSTNGGSSYAVIPESNYTLQYLGGFVTFTSARAVGALVRITGFYYALMPLGGFMSWSADLEQEILDSTTMNNPSGAKSVTPGIISGSIDVEGFWVDNYFYRKVINSPRLVIQLFVDPSGPHYDCYCYASKASPVVDFSDLITESRTLTVSGDVIFRMNP